jgi:hypothetical protein
MTGMSAALAVDPPPTTVAVTGSLHDADGVLLGGIALRINVELPPDGGLAGVEVLTTTGGGFDAFIPALGATARPATLTIRTLPDQLVYLPAGSCSRTFGVTVDDTRTVALAETTDPLPPIELVATTTLLGEACGATATPPVLGAVPADPAPNVTPPPTDAIRPALGGGSERLPTALLVGFAVGLAVAFLFLVPRPGARRD